MDLCAPLFTLVDVTKKFDRLSKMPDGGVKVALHEMEKIQTCPASGFSGLIAEGMQGSSGLAVKSLTTPRLAQIDQCAGQ